MNWVHLVGRLTKNPDVRYSTGDNPSAVARYTLAVDRRFAKEGERSADFISCVAFGKNGEFAEKYLHKGQKIAVSGSIRTGSYTDKEGSKRYTTDVVVTEHTFCEKAGSSNDKPDSGAAGAEDDFMNIPDGDMEELPFK